MDEKRDWIYRYCDYCCDQSCPYWDIEPSWCSTKSVHQLTEQEAEEVFNKLNKKHEDVLESMEIPKEDDTPDNTQDTPEDNVINHPNHYTCGGMESIDEMVLVFGVEAVKHFCLCNIWKYRRRAMYKNGEEDMKKSHWYMNKYRELCEYGREETL